MTIRGWGKGEDGIAMDGKVAREKDVVINGRRMGKEHLAWQFQ